MKIGIMGAMEEEVGSLREHMTDIREEERGGRVFIQGKMGGADVVVVFSRWGKVASATTATALIERYNVDQIVFTGVAGAASSNLNIGDIVISEQLYQHDMDGRPIMPEKHEIPLTGITFFKADPALIRKAEAATDGLFHSLSQKIDTSSMARFGITEPKFVRGTIATGDEFVYSQERTKAILADRPETNAIEMEGAAVAQVCTDYKIPFVVIRTISDKADHTSAVDFPAFIEKIAKHYSEHVVLAMLRA